MSIANSLDPARQDLAAIHRMIAGTSRSPGIRREVVADALRNSIAAVAIDHTTGDTLGVTRVVTDRATFEGPCEAIADKRFRGQGPSRRRIEEPEGHPEPSALRRWCLATHHADVRYRKSGSRPVPPDRWLAWVGPKDAWQVDAAGDDGRIRPSMRAGRLRGHWLRSARPSRRAWQTGTPR